MENRQSTHSNRKTCAVQFHSLRIAKENVRCRRPTFYRTEELITAGILTNYYLTDPFNSKLLNRSFSDIYLVTCLENKYILRILRTGSKSLDVLRYELALLMHSNGNGATVAIPIARKDGAWFTSIKAPEGIRYAEQGLETGACHSDLHGANAHIDEGNRVTFFDFDECGPSYYAYELAVLRWSEKTNTQLTTLFPAYLKGYSERRAVKDVDFAAIPLFVAARHWVRTTFWGIALGDLNRPYLQSPKMGRTLDTCGG